MVCDSLWACDYGGQQTSEQHSNFSQSEWEVSC